MAVVQHLEESTFRQRDAPAAREVLREVKHGRP